MPDFPLRYRRPTLAEIVAAISTRARVWSASDVKAAIDEHAPTPENFERPSTTQLQNWTSNLPYVWAPVDMHAAVAWHGSSNWKKIVVGDPVEFPATTASSQMLYSHYPTVPVPQIGDLWVEETWGQIIPNGESVGIGFLGRFGGPEMSVYVGGVTVDSTWYLRRQVVRTDTYDYASIQRLEVTDGINGGLATGSPYLTQRSGVVENYFSGPDFVLGMSFDTDYGAGTKLILHGGSLTYTPRQS